MRFGMTPSGVVWFYNGKANVLILGDSWEYVHNRKSHNVPRPPRRFRSKDNLESEPMSIVLEEIKE